MRAIFFTKMIREQSVPQIIATLKRIGADGADLCVRPGYPVNPDNCVTELPNAAAALREAGLDIPLVSAPTEMIDPNSKDAQAIFRACHDARVLNVKVGYWSYKPGDYWQQLDKARRQVEGFASLAMRFGVKACMHTHSGMHLGLNAASASHLARNFSPSQIGIYLDTGHMALYGEPPDLAVAMAAPHHCLMAIKDSEWVKVPNGKPRTPKFSPPGQGSADFTAWGAALRRVGFSGPVSFHSEYEAANLEERLRQTTEDISFIRKSFGF